jgi:hypothetical protein
MDSFSRRTHPRERQLHQAKKSVLKITPAKVAKPAKLPRPAYPPRPLLLAGPVLAIAPDNTGLEGGEVLAFSEGVPAGLPPGEGADKSRSMIKDRPIG